VTGSAGDPSRANVKVREAMTERVLRDLIHVWRPAA
jgi:hypothetical protein